MPATMCAAAGAGGFRGFGYFRLGACASFLIPQLHSPTLVSAHLTSCSQDTCNTSRSNITEVCPPERIRNELRGQTVCASASTCSAAACRAGCRAFSYVRCEATGRLVELIKAEGAPYDILRILRSLSGRRKCARRGTLSYGMCPPAPRSRLALAQASMMSPVHARLPAVVMR